MPDRPDWSGTPLVHGITSIFSATGVIPANSFINTAGPTPVDAPGYLIEIQTTPNAASTNPACTVTLRWYDTSATQVIARQDWTLIGNTTGNWAVFGQGPARGAFVQVTFTNNDAANSMGVQYSMVSATHHIARDDWRSNLPSGVIPGFTVTDGQNLAENVLADYHTILAAGSETQLLPLYAGQAFFSFVAQSTPAAGGQLAITIQPVPAASHGIVWAYVNAAVPVNPGVAVVGQVVTLPREQCQIILANNGTQSVTFNGLLIAQEFAS